MEIFENIAEPTSTLVSAIMMQKVDPDVYADWLLLFDYYHRETGVKKSMGCRPCYGLIYAWYKKREKAFLHEENSQRDQDLS